MLEMFKKAKEAKTKLKELSEMKKDEALMNIAFGIQNNAKKIIDANNQDLKNAKKLLEEGEITKAIYDRLKLDERKLAIMIKGIHDIIRLKSPTDKVEWRRELDSDLILEKISSPIGVIGVIFEARPDVIVQITSLTIKTSNVVILKGGREAQNTNKAFFDTIISSIKNVEGFPLEAVNLIHTREDVANMLKMNEYIDLIIPRGSNSLVKYIQENTKIPVLGHASGICHIFVDESAKKDEVKNIVLDSKAQYPSACNSVETLLIHKNYPHKDDLIQFLKENGIEIVENPKNYETEYSDKILSVKIVDSLEDAINQYGSNHTDAILTENKKNAEEFLSSVDSANVFHNVSTRFSDGFRYGFGAEVGISTNKTLARGPVGMDGLCTYKYIIRGKNQIVADYVSGQKKFTHKNI